MERLERVVLTDKDKVLNIGSSRGSQSKFKHGDYWYKIDKYGNESLCEELASIVLEYSNCTDYVRYFRCLINGVNGCKSKNFLREDETIFSLESLYKKVRGGSLSSTWNNMGTAEEKLDYVLNFFNGVIDISDYLRMVLSLDYLILNEDRHLNNLLLIASKDGYKTAPIYDNGYSLMSCSGAYNKYLSLEENVKRVTSKPFSGSPLKQLNLMGNCMKLDYIGLLKCLGSLEKSLELSILEYMLMSSKHLYADFKVWDLVYNNKQVGVRVKSGRNYYDIMGRFRVLRSEGILRLHKIGNRLISDSKDCVRQIRLSSFNINLLNDYVCVL